MAVLSPGSMSRQPQRQRADPVDVGFLAPERDRDRLVVFDDDARVAELQGTQLGADRPVARHPRRGAEPERPCLLGHPAGTNPNGARPQAPLVVTAAYP